MRKHILLRAVVFFAIFLAIFIRLSYILRPYTGNASRKNLCGFYAEENNSLDVVFIGSSSVFAFWIPFQFWNEYGAASYNFAAAQFPVQLTRPCIEEIRKTQNPDLFVIDVRPFAYAEATFGTDSQIPNMYNDAAFRNVADNMKYSWNRQMAIDQGLPKEYDRLPYVIDFIKYHTEWDHLADMEAISYIWNSKKNKWKGYYTVNRIQSQEITDYSGETSRKPLSENLDSVLSDLLEYCKKNELEVLFLVNAYNQVSSQKATYNYIEDRIASYGYCFLDANDKMDEIGLDPRTDFYDRYHVNYLGAEKYTAYVGKYIMDHYQLPDHREDAAYREWEEAYEAWLDDAIPLKKRMKKKAIKRLRKLEKEEKEG